MGLLAKYSPETRQAKKERLAAVAADKSAAKTDKPIHIKFGLNHVTQLVEEKRAALVVIAHDVDPIEMVVFLPALCRKAGVPYCFIRGKANLGKLCHMKTATCVAVTDVRKEDHADLDAMSKQFKNNFNDNKSLRKEWGGGIMG